MKYIKFLLFAFSLTFAFIPHSAFANIIYSNISVGADSGFTGNCRPVSCDNLYLSHATEFSLGQSAIVQSFRIVLMTPISIASSMASNAVASWEIYTDNSFTSVFASGSNAGVITSTNEIFDGRPDGDTSGFRYFYMDVDIADFAIDSGDFLFSLSLPQLTQSITGASWKFAETQVGQDIYQQNSNGDWSAFIGNRNYDLQLNGTLDAVITANEPSGTFFMLLVVGAAFVRKGYKRRNVFYLNSQIVQ